MRDVVVRPMSHDLLLWRCLHGGPQSTDTIERLPEARRDEWLAHRALNIPLLTRLTDTYQSCAMLAWHGEQVVGFLRFYPKAVLALPEAGGMCLQQTFPNGPSEAILGRPLPRLELLADKTCVVHCLMTGSPFQAENPYQRRGIGTRLAQALIGWAGARGWRAIEAYAYHDLDILYANTGQAGLNFWRRLGFVVVAEERESEFRGQFLETMRTQAVQGGLDPELACNRYTMRLELG